MSKIILDNILSGFNLSKINANFTKIMNALNNNVLWSTLPTGETNTVNNDLDMNGKHIYNLPTPALDNEPVRVKDIKDRNTVLGFIASAIAFSPTAQILSTNVQAAIVEVFNYFFNAQLTDYTVLRSYTGSNKLIYITAQGISGTFIYDPTDTTSIDNGGTVIVDALGRRWKRAYSCDVDIKWFGAIGDGLSDNRSIIISALQWCAANNKTLYISDGIYACSNWIPLPSNIKLVFSKNARWKLLNSTSLGGFVCGGYDINLNRVPFVNAEIYGINLDCNNIAGENGFNAVNAQSCLVYSPVVKNTLFSSSKLGGRAFQFEGSNVDGVHIFEPYIENCSIGINSHADSSGATEVARFISYYDVVMRNVDVPFNIDGQFANPELGTPVNMSTFVHGANLFNCGKLTFSGAVGAGAGIICGDRGYGLKISGLRIVNTSTYGGIGGLVRGTVFGVEINDVKIDAPDITALFNFEPVGFGSPSSASFACTVNAENVNANSNLDYVVKGSIGGKVGKCSFDKIYVNANNATLTGICDSAATINGLGYLNLILTDQNFRSTGLQPLINLYTYGANNIGSCIQQYEEGEWTPADASGAGLSLTIPDSCRYVKTGRVVTAFFRVTYPTTANVSSAVIGGLPYTAANFSANAGTLSIGYSSVPSLAHGYVSGSTKTMSLTNSSGVAVQNSAMSGGVLYGTVTYLT